jgi:hypothetical protein
LLLLLLLSLLLRLFVFRRRSERSEEPLYLFFRGDPSKKPVNPQTHKTRANPALPFAKELCSTSYTLDRIEKMASCN